MKKLLSYFMLWMAFSLVACSVDVSNADEPSPSGVVTTNEEAVSDEKEDLKEMDNKVRKISVQFGDHVIIYELNESEAAVSLYEQLPLTIESENFSTNEKIFYPPKSLNLTDGIKANGGSGVLAYYEPWGDVVMFYGDFNQNLSLYELGHVVSGEELIQEISGTITIDIMD